jgi:hypothetical protein
MLFGEADYDLVNGAANIFTQPNFGIRYAFEAKFKHCLWGRWPAKRAS